MVKLKDNSEYDKLDQLLHELCDKYSYKLYVNGWTRKTYDVFIEDGSLGKSNHVARIESFATTNGEIHFFDERVTDFVTELGEQLESVFGVTEATLLRCAQPEY
ncbi:MAG: hypothetical protein ACI8W8_000564 [Rhodothermales bacterium]|jgi:hypothetical protein